MLRKIGFALLCAMASFSTFANENVHTLQPGVTIEFDFPPNVPQVFLNWLYWEVTANCKITTPDQSDEFFVEALAKKGKVNNVTLSKGQTLRLTVRQGDNLKLSAESGAKVQITNLGVSKLRATCVA